MPTPRDTGDPAFAASAHPDRIVTTAWSAENPARRDTNDASGDENDRWAAYALRLAVAVGSGPGTVVGVAR